MPAASPAAGSRPLQLALRVTALLCAALPATAAAPTPAVEHAAPTVPAAAPRLAFRIDQGGQTNAFLRDGDVAAQLVLRAGRQPRVIVAFPAGDSGTGVWLHAPHGQPVHWELLQSPQPLRLLDAKGRALRGLQVEVRADVPTLDIDQVLLSSIRVLRNHEAGQPIPASVLTTAQLSAARAVWSRDRLDGAAGYRLVIHALEGAHLDAHRIQAAAGARTLHLRLQALSGEAPLEPLDESALLRASAAANPQERHIFEFLSYQQKYLAGAWRFDTYFGRDTLFSLLLLAPVLQPAAITHGIDSVLARLSAQGEVAHEEAIGEYAILLNAAAGRGASAAPLYDYSMVDEDFLLAPLAARWLLDDPSLRREARAFLAAKDARAERRGDALLRNLRYVVTRTRAFAASPVPANLIVLKPRERAGDWRDSDDGLDGGRYPYDVNVSLAPAALGATQRLLDSGLLAPYLSASDRTLLAQAGRQQAIWTRYAAPLFRIDLKRPAALARLRDYARSLQLDATAAARTLRDPVVHLDALSLDARGRPLPVMHSDVAFELLLNQPDAQRVAQILATLMRPFPAGLMTPIGLLVADPAFGGASERQRFTRAAYHGTVVWAWQQAVLLAGIARQLQRHDLPAALRSRLVDARAALWRAVDRASGFEGSELWSWSHGRQGFQLHAFHAQAAGEAESDAAQLWSSVFLAVPRVGAPAATVWRGGRPLRIRAVWQAEGSQGFPRASAQLSQLARVGDLGARQ